MPKIVKMYEEFWSFGKCLAGSTEITTYSFNISYENSYDQLSYKSRLFCKKKNKKISNSKSDV